MTLDIASLCSLLLAFVGILGGMLLEGGSITQIAQPTAFFIVLGGTAGAVLLQFPLAIFLDAFNQAAHLLFAQTLSEVASEAAITRLVILAAKARRNGIISIDADLASIEDPFLKQALMLAIDISEPTEVRTTMELHMESSADREDRISQVFEAIGGYAPTVGILGAVLGLIQVMQHLDDIAAVGRGIAVAFVATIYGVALANLVALPIAGKLRMHHEEEQRRQRMMLEGVILILEGMSPRMIEIRLRTFLTGTTPAAVRTTAEAAEKVTA
jgi:chemotaxis protein MotA